MLVLAVLLSVGFVWIGKKGRRQIRAFAQQIFDGEAYHPGPGNSLCGKFDGLDLEFRHSLVSARGSPAMRRSGRVQETLMWYFMPVEHRLHLVIAEENKLTRLAQRFGFAEELHTGDPALDSQLAFGSDTPTLLKRVMRSEVLREALRVLLSDDHFVTLLLTPAGDLKDEPLDVSSLRCKRPGILLGRACFHKTDHFNANEVTVDLEAMVDLRALIG
jgi:hypothetical protein